MRIDILTLFPDTVNAVLHESILGRAAKKGIIEINCVQIRDFTENKQCQVDDYPYGGGWGCVMMAQPLKSCLDHVIEQAGEKRRRVIYMSPQGKPFNQTEARRLKADYDHLVLVCGHYEGVDERFIESCVDEEISLGDFVLTGGEIAAMAVADCVCRMVPGVLADEQCYTGESHWDGLLEYPQYTRPEVWEGREVPEVLIKGDHDRVDTWRRKKQLERTMVKRPDMFERFSPETELDRELLREIEKDEKRTKLTEPLSVVPAKEEDLVDITQILQYARKTLKKHRVDQWQGDYPAAEDIEKDIEEGKCYLLKHGGETAGFYVLSAEHEANYDAITDGKWSNEEPYCVLHRCAVSEKYRGSGMAQYMMRKIEEQAESLGIRYIRTDTHRKNKSMQTLLRENGYRYRGNVLVDEPVHDPARQAFEKLIKKNRR